MRRLAAITFILVFTLNTLGYYGVYFGLQYQHEVSISKSLDKDQYESSQIVTLNLPVAVPYMPDQPGFERVHGVFEYEGEYYRLVKQRYANDTLTIICLKDVEHKRIDLALTDYVKTFVDHIDDHKATTKMVVSISKDYLPINVGVISSSHGWVLESGSTTDQPTLLPTFSASIVHPPERMLHC